jgi:hypothetical protein
MIARDRGRRLGRALVAWSAVGAAGVVPAFGQQAGRGTPASARPAASRPIPAGLGQGQQDVSLVAKKVPVNPGDPVATVNGEVITYGQLTGECVSRKGEEVLETLIARKLIEQALRARKMEVKAEEIDAEIDRQAATMAGMTRENWLRVLAKDRNISPVQYARDIIYPALALRKLAWDRVQVTEDDVKDAYDANFGERLKCRIIMTGTVEHAKQIWEELKKNPSRFEWIAQNDNRSIDQVTRSMGGLLTEPLTRHAAPRTVSDAAFAQLVDLDPKVDRRNKAEVTKYAPKDGDFTGPIQVTPASWVIIRREGVIPARPYDPKSAETRAQMTEAIREAKLKDEMGKVYNDLLERAAIDNKLSGHTTTVRADEAQPVPHADNAGLMANDPRVVNKNKIMPAPKPSTTDASVGRARVSPPPGVSQADADQAEVLKRK